MAVSRLVSRPYEVDPLGLAVGSALVAGALSLLDPFLVSLVGALAALALASWMTSPASRRPFDRRRLTGRTVLGLAFLSVGAGLFLYAPPEIGASRGAILAVSLLPLWWTGRAGARRHADPEGPA